MENRLCPSGLGCVHSPVRVHQVWSWTKDKYSFEEIAQGFLPALSTAHSSRQAMPHAGVWERQVPQRGQARIYQEQAYWMSESEGQHRLPDNLGGEHPPSQLLHHTLLPHAFCSNHRPFRALEWDWLLDREAPTPRPSSSNAEACSLVPGSPASSSRAQLLSRPAWNCQAHHKPPEPEPAPAQLPPPWPPHQSTSQAAGGGGQSPADAQVAPAPLGWGGRKKCPQVITRYLWASVHPFAQGGDHNSKG